MFRIKNVNLFILPRKLNWEEQFQMHSIFFMIQIFWEWNITYLKKSECFSLQNAVISIFLLCMFHLLFSYGNIPIKWISSWMFDDNYHKCALIFTISLDWNCTKTCDRIWKSFFLLLWSEWRDFAHWPFNIISISIICAHLDGCFDLDGWNIRRWCTKKHTLQNVCAQSSVSSNRLNTLEIFTENITWNIHFRYS